MSSAPRGVPTKLPAQDHQTGPTAHDRVQGLERVNVGEGQDVVLESRLRPQILNRVRGDDRDDGRRRGSGEVCRHDYLYQACPPAGEEHAGENALVWHIGRCEAHKACGRGGPPRSIDRLGVGPNSMGPNWPGGPTGPRPFMKGYD